MTIGHRQGSGQCFDVSQPNQIPVTGIKFVKTHEGRPYQYFVIDLFSRRVFGRSAQSRMTTDFSLQAPLMIEARCGPASKAMVLPGQGSQFTRREWQTFLRKHDLETGISRLGDTLENAVAKSISQTVKRERIKRRTCPAREAARQEVPEYFELI